MAERVLSGALGLATLAGASMLVADTFAAIYELLLVRGRPLLAGCFDGAEDIASLVSFGGGINALWKGGGEEGVMVCAAIWAGSVGGAWLGDALTERYGGGHTTTPGGLVRGS